MKIELWEILVPVRNKDVPIIKRFHKRWDAKVRAITGGLTIRPPEKGQWHNSKIGAVEAEQMIPVKIAATREQMLQIGQMTAEYYNQEVVMFYRISDEVIFMRKDGSLS
jgi:hypothetical protein